MCKIFDEVREEGREEGRQAGIEAGRWILCQGLVELLQGYGELSVGIKEKIEQEKDMKQLLHWYRQASQIQNVEEFVM